MTSNIKSHLTGLANRIKILDLFMDRKVHSWSEVLAHAKKNGISSETTVRKALRRAIDGGILEKRGRSQYAATFKAPDRVKALRKEFADLTKLEERHKAVGDLPGERRDFRRVIVNDPRGVPLMSASVDLRGKDLSLRHIFGKPKWEEIERETQKYFTKLGRLIDDEDYSTFGVQMEHANPKKRPGEK